MTKTEIATLAGGCFWCLEAVYLEMEGVTGVQSGYMGGQVDHPSYEAVCTGRTGHAEVVQLTFNPEVTSFRDILEVFFTIHDPTTLNRQGNDVGSQYRSAIFYHSEEQRTTAEEVIGELTAQRLWPDPIVTQVEKASTFFPAEGYHDDYYRRNPHQPYCTFVVEPKVQKFRKKHADKMRSKAS
jgi:peptide-methionine (S)-S-oxide reductase